MGNFSIATLISRAIVLLVAMTVHEFAHAYVAHLNGDDTAKEQGRMTLNPAANIFPLGFLIGVLTGFGILGSAPVNPHRMHNPRWGTFWAVLAGPVSNLLVAAVFAVPFRLGLISLAAATRDAIPGFAPSLQGIALNMVVLNVVLFIFNLLPLFPLDGWTVALTALPAQPAVWWQRQQQNSMYVLYGLIALSFIVPSLARISPILGFLDVLNWLIWTPTSRLIGALLGL